MLTRHHPEATAASGLFNLIRQYAIWLILITVLLASVLLSLLAGYPQLSLADLYLSLVSDTQSLQQSIQGPIQKPIQQLVLTELRFPRLIAGLLTGAAMGCAGFLLQRLSQNPLTSPSTLGVTQGSALALVLVFILGIEMSPVMRFSAALIGALFAGGLLLVLMLANRQRNDTSTLILLGALMASFFAALTTSMLLLEQHAINAIRFWLSGSLAFVPAELLPVLALICLSCFALSYLMLPGINLVTTGEAKASSLGISPLRVYLVVLVLILLLTGASVAVTGPILFTGLVVPHLARLLVGVKASAHLSASLLLGAVMMTLADGLTRWVAPETPVSPSIPMAIIGAPWFMWLVYQRYRT